MPQDPMMLLSFVNTALRDTYPDLKEFCRAFDVDETYIVEKLRSIDYEYDAALNRFV